MCNVEGTGDAELYQQFTYYLCTCFMVLQDLDSNENERAKYDALYFPIYFMQLVWTRGF